MKRLLSSPFFLIAAISFFLPFFAVTCAGLENLPEQVGAGAEPPEVTGFELATGTAEDELAETQDFAATPEIPLPDIPGIPTPAIPTPEVSIAPEGVATDFDLGLVQIYAIAAGGAVAAGVLLSLLGQRFGGAVALILGAGAVAVLFLMQREFQDVILDAVGPEAQGFIDVEPRLGFWGALGGAGVAGLMGLVRLFMPAGGRGGRAVGFESGPAAAAPAAAAETTEAETTEEEPPPPPPPASPPPETTPPPPK